MKYRFWLNRVKRTTQKNQLISNKIEAFFLIEEEEEFNTYIREDLYKNSKEEISEEAYTLWWNVAPGQMQIITIITRKEN